MQEPFAVHGEAPIATAFESIMNAGKFAGAAVVLEPEQALPTLCGGGAGAVGWPGGFGGWWQADPNDDSVLIFLAHNLVELDQLEQGIGLGVYRAITEFQALASTPQ